MTVTADIGATIQQGGVQTGSDGIYQVLARLDAPCYVVDTGGGIGVTNERPARGSRVLATVGPQQPERLGSPSFRRGHGVRYAYMAGAMANGVASDDMVIAMARAGMLGSFGAAGLLADRIDTVLRRFATEIPGLPFAANLIHSPVELSMEQAAVELYLRHGVRCVEASAFMDLTPNIVRYRVAGLARDRSGRVVARNRVIAKVSRPEVAARFMRPAPEALVSRLRADGLITEEQAELARVVPMADDITVEADSGGHTDRRPLSALLPAISRQRDRIATEYDLVTEIRIGAAGGIGTPRAAAAAFCMGADYIVTGSVNQSCVESGTSDATRRLLAGADITDCEMAPAADMFELGVELQTLKKGTLFPMRAKRLYELYRAYDGIEQIPADELERLERQVFRRSIDDIWEDVVSFFDSRDPAQVARAAGDGKRRMALIFRWYLGMSSQWAAIGQPDRAIDYQIWCGPSMGSFNDWASGTYLAPVENRHVADVGLQLVTGAAFTQRVNQLRGAGVRLPSRCGEYRPEPGVG